VDAVDEDEPVLSLVLPVEAVDDALPVEPEDADVGKAEVGEIEVGEIEVGDTVLVLHIIFFCRNRGGQVRDNKIKKENKRKRKKRRKEKKKERKHSFLVPYVVVLIVVVVSQAGLRA
jgi:hypothetical protein